MPPNAKIIRPSVAVVILAGGKSSRMGSDKAKLQLGDISLLEHMQQILNNANVQDIYINDQYNIADVIANRGPLSGFHAALCKFIGQYDFLIITPIDMPELLPAIFTQLNHASSKYNIVHFKNHILPLRIRVSDANIKIVTDILQKTTDFSVMNFIRKFDTLEIDDTGFDDKIFQNINTLKQWVRYHKSK
ncbi:MAG: molybdenum cofactor guanylyltransferase [Rhizobiales bacterium]|nr:molybdenum cofactor guanylyltransferase [Hyphomicrobiales bacterium]